MPLIVRMFNRFIHFRWARSTASYVIKLRDFRRLFEVDKKMSDDNPSNDSASDNKPHFELYIKVCTQNLKISKSANTAWGFGACFFASDISERILQMFIFCNIHNYLNTHWNNRLLHILIIITIFRLTITSHFRRFKFSDEPQAPNSAVQHWPQAQVVVQLKTNNVLHQGKQQIFKHLFVCFLKCILLFITCWINVKTKPKGQSRNPRHQTTTVEWKIDDKR